MSTGALEAATTYLARGWLPVPVPVKRKKPTINDWPSLALSEADLPKHFSNGANVGLILGARSGGLVDVDLDAPEALRCAHAFLPPTGRVHGRAGKPASHRWYIADPPPERVARYKALDGETLVELRSTGGQTIVPPSTHPSGEAIVWEEEGEPARASAQSLGLAVRRLAAAALLARHWPSEGGRHDAALALAGLLMHGGFTEDDAATFVEAVAFAAGDREARDRGACARTTARRIESGGKAAGGPTLEKIVGEEVVARVREWLGLAAGAGKVVEEERPSQATRLVLLAAGADYFRDGRDFAYVAIKVNGHRETLPVRSRAFRRWLAKLFYDAEGKAPGGQAVEDAMRTLEGKAFFEGEEREVFLRVGHRGGKVYLDLANVAWQAVEIDAEGWRVVDEPPIFFRRSPGMKPLPMPERGGTLEELRSLLNAESDDAWKTFAAWLVGAMHPTGPYPLLLLLGEQGSAKSSTARMLRSIVDPSAAELRTVPREERDLVIAAWNGWIVSLDNLSGLPEWLSNGICRLATGGGFAARTLYENDEETILDVKRPVVLNGIEDAGQRPDLLDRALVVSLPAIPETARRTEEEIRAAFEAVRPRVLGALFDAASSAIRNRPTTRLAALPRMADFALWVEAAAPALGWAPGSFAKLYQERRAETTAAVLEADPVAGAIQALLAAGAPVWLGTAADLIEALGRHVTLAVRESRGWPKGPGAIAGRLRKLAPALRSIGIQVSKDRTERRRLIRLERVAPAPGMTMPDDPDDGHDDPATEDRHAVSANQVRGCGDPDDPDDPDDLSTPLSYSDADEDAPEAPIAP